MRKYLYSCQLGAVSYDVLIHYISLFITAALNQVIALSYLISRVDISWHVTPEELSLTHGTWAEH